MRNTILVGLLLAVSGCATEADINASADALRWGDAQQITIDSVMLGVPATAGPDCSRTSTRYDFTDGRLVDSNCRGETVHVGLPEDTAALRVALRGVRLVEQPCEGQDGTDVSVRAQRTSDDAGSAYPLGSLSCTFGGDPTRPVPMVSSESWGPVAQVLARIRATR